MSETTDIDAELDAIPGMVSADDMRASLLATGDLPHWNSFERPNFQATDFAELAPELAEKVVAARMLAGPGPHGTEWQWALYEHNTRLVQLERERDQIVARMTEVSHYARDTGEAISALPPDRVAALGYELTQITAELERLEGPAGEEALKRKLEEAVRKERQKLKRQYVIAEAKKRASAQALEEEIAAAAAGFKKTR